MEKNWSLKRTVQCAKCPWKVKTNPFDIPGNYCETKHCNLESTIADPENPVQSFLAAELKGEWQIMACHHSKPGEEEHCVGWIENQLGEGNNIMLRLRMMSCANASELRTVGEQHRRFEDTLPQNKLNDET